MSYIDLDRAELMMELEKAGKRFTALLRSLQHGDEAKPCLGLTGNGGEVAAHVLTVVRRSLGDRRRSATPAELADLNTLSMAELNERQAHVIADLIDADMDVVLNRVYPKIDDDRRFPFHGGTMIGARQALAITTGEFTIHGWDIARACGIGWEFSPHVMALAWRGIIDPIAAWLKPGEADGLSEIYAFQLEGEMGTLALQFADNTVRVLPHWSGTAPYVISSNPIELTLTFPYGRYAAKDEALARLVARFQPI